MTHRISKTNSDKEQHSAVRIDDLPSLVVSLRQLIAESLQQVLRAVDAQQVQTYWHIGRHIVEFEQGGAQRTSYVRGLLTQLGQTLTAEFGRGFDTTNLRHMRGFYLAFLIRDAVRRELSCNATVKPLKNIKI